MRLDLVDIPKEKDADSDLLVAPFGQSLVQKHYWVETLITPSEISTESESTTERMESELNAGK